MSPDEDPQRHRHRPPPPPPVARRDEGGFVIAGAAPEGWDGAAVPRQLKSSSERLLDPPTKIADPYGWLRDESRQKKEVLEHLEAENAYCRDLTEHLEGLRGRLYDEFLASIQETDHGTPRPDRGYYYYSRTYEGKSYSAQCRAPRTSDGGAFDDGGERSVPPITWDGRADAPVLPGEQVILDVNLLAEGKDYCSTGSVVSSPSQELLAYAVDFKGDETCGMWVKDLKTGEIVDHDETLEISGSIRWGADDDTLFYLKQDATKRPYQVYRRKIGSDSEDEMLFEEPDEAYYVGIYKSLDQKYLFIEASSKETSEIHFLDLADPNAKLMCISRRRAKVLYEVEHRQGTWWLSSNVGDLPNMALWTAPAVADCEDRWELVRDPDGEPLFDGGYDRSLDSVSCFSRHVVASGREGGLPRVWIIGLGDDSTVQKFERLTFAEDAYDVGVGTNYEYDTNNIVVEYDSLVTPTQSIEINMDDTSKRTVLKEKNVPGYNKELFGCDRFTVTSRDGKTEIPVSMVYRRDVMEKHEASGEPVRVHLYGYGSYGACMEANFASTRIPLLNRGIVYVIAHVRGGGEMGRQWYEEPNGAKYLCKKNTFNDFVDVARWLVEVRKLTMPDLMSCEGRSAGGLLIGASINQAPELFKVAVLGVPFVDVVPTMIDASIPLTGEYT
jgi:oligopeptidase B